MSARRKLQLWAVCVDADVWCLLVLCHEHAAVQRDPDFILPPPATHTFRVRNSAWLRLVRDSPGCGECAIRGGRRVAMLDAGAIGELKASDLAVGGDA